MWKRVWVGFWSHPCSMKGLEKAFLSLLVDFVITPITQIWGNQDLFKIAKNWISPWEYIIFPLLNGSHQIVTYLGFFLNYEQFQRTIVQKMMGEHVFLPKWCRICPAHNICIWSTVRQGRAGRAWRIIMLKYSFFSYDAVSDLVVKPFPKR